MAEIIPLPSKYSLPSVELVIGYIHNGVVRQEFFDSWMNFNMFNSQNRKIPYAFINCGSLYLANNRNIVTRDFYDNHKAPLFLCMDTDIKFEPEVIYKLIDAVDPVERPIVSALYFTYYGKNHMSTADVVPVWSNYTDGRGFELVPQVYADEIQQIDGIGFGCVVLHRNAIAKFIGQYEDWWTWFGHDVIKVDGKEMRLGEDYTFCKRAKDLGIPIFGHGDAIVTHIKNTPLNLDTVIKNNQADVHYKEG